MRRLGVRAPQESRGARAALDGLQRAGFESAVVALGENASQIAAAIQQALKAGLSIQVIYVYVPPTRWRSLANSIICARMAFPGDEPFLIIRADQLYNWRLLHRVRPGGRLCLPRAQGERALPKLLREVARPAVLCVRGAAPR